MLNIDKHKLNNTKLRIWIILLVGCISLFIYYISKISIFSGLGGAFIAAAVISLILRVPSLLDDVNKSSINLLKDNEFLNRLSVEELQKLRVAATECGYLKSAHSVNKSLSVIDNKIANLFLEPYFHSYLINVRCRLDGDIINKIVSTDFILKNPNKKELNGLKFIKPRVVQKKIEGKENNEIRVIKSFKVLKDDENEYKDMSSKVELKFDDFSEEASNYNVISSIVPKGEHFLNDLSFTSSLHIKIVEERIVEKKDSTYVRRVTNPVENFSINYSFDNCDVDLIGNGFGTFQDTKDGGISIFKDGNSIHISSKKWLLTGNGIIIVHNYNE